MPSRSAISPGPVGFQFSFRRVSALEEGISSTANAGKPAEVRLSLLGLDADHRHLQPAAHAPRRWPSSSRPPRRLRGRSRPAPPSQTPNDKAEPRRKRVPPASDCSHRRCTPRRPSRATRREGTAPALACACREPAAAAPQRCSRRAPSTPSPPLPKPRAGSMMRSGCPRSMACRPHWLRSPSPR